MMRKGPAVISALFACGIVGGLYGVMLGAVDMGLLSVRRFGIAETQNLAEFLVVAIVWGAIFGFPAGFLSGVLGGSLGGPFGFSIGGFVGTGGVMFLCFGGAEGLRALGVPLADQPSIWGAAFGLVFGLHIQRRLRVLPGLGWLADLIYGSPLGGWLGWRQRHVE